MEDIIEFEEVIEVIKEPKKAYLYDEFTKEFISEVNAQIDPLESELKGEEVYLLPANASFTPPLEEKDGFKVVFKGDEWVYEEIHEPEPSPEPTEEEIKQNRIWELKSKLQETDYIVIKIAEGEATQEEYAEVLAQRKAWRVEINELQA